jgi:inward rectifier potassium channel
VVHPITPESPLWQVTQEQLLENDTEFIALLKGFDDTFSQTVHARFSWRPTELVWDAKFVPAFFVESTGNYVLNLDMVSDYEKL